MEEYGELYFIFVGAVNGCHIVDPDYWKYGPF